MRWKRRKKEQPKRLKGPCIFGCRTSGKTTALARRADRWQAVPSPSPWPGIRPGETLCMKCYAWGVSNPRARARRQRDGAQIGLPAIRVGHQYRLGDLRNRTDLNGKLVTVEFLPDDHDRVVVLLGDVSIRVHSACLQNPVVDCLQDPAIAVHSAARSADLSHRRAASANSVLQRAGNSAANIGGAPN